MAKLRAAVLAADRSPGGDAPTALTPIEGEPLLNHTLESLKQAGIDDLLVVTGVKSADVQSLVSERWGEATFVFNARYASWGNFHSVRMALDQSPGIEVMVVNTNVVVDPDVLRRVTGAPGDLVATVQRRHRFGPDDMRVTLRDGRVRAIGRGIKQAHTHAEYCGVSLIRPAAARLFQDIATDQQWYARTNITYEDIYNLMLGGIDARAVDVQGNEYAKVANPNDIPVA